MHFQYCMIFDFATGSKIKEQPFSECHFHGLASYLYFIQTIDLTYWLSNHQCPLQPLSKMTKDLVQLFGSFNHCQHYSLINLTFGRTFVNCYLNTVRRVMTIVALAILEIKTFNEDQVSLFS